MSNDFTGTPDPNQPRRVCSASAATAAFVHGPDFVRHPSSSAGDSAADSDLPEIDEDDPDRAPTMVR